VVPLRQERRERSVTRKDQTDERQPWSISRTTVLLCDGHVDSVPHAQVVMAAKRFCPPAILDSVASPQSMLFSIFSHHPFGGAPAPELSSIGFPSHIVSALSGRAITAIWLRGRASCPSGSGVAANSCQCLMMENETSHLRHNGGRCRLPMTSQQPQNASRSPGTPKTIVVTTSVFIL
jgi:hypothetical protein